MSDNPNAAQPATDSVKGSLSRLRSTLYTAARFLLNKLATIILFLVLAAFYLSIPDVKYDEITGAKTGGMPLSELLYAVMLVIGTTVFAPLTRLLVFPEAADYAEQGWLRKDLETSNHSVNFVHYWRATAISYLITIACLATLAH